MMDDLSQNRAPAVIRICIGMMTFSTIAIVLRFWSRAVTVRSQGSNNIAFWWDDWLALASVPFALCQFAMTIAWTHVGLGQHVEASPLSRVESGLMIFYIGYQWYHLSTILIKFSVLAFYIRLFSGNSKKLDYATYFGIAICAVYYLIYVFIDIFQCTPMRKAWQPELPGHCINIYNWWLSYAIVSTALDIMILSIPMPLLWSLKLKPLKKLGIIGLFAAGYCVVLISIGRIVTVVVVGNNLKKDVTYQVVTPLIWLTAEPGISTLSICLPSIYSLIKRGVEYGPEALFSSKSISELYSNGHTPRIGGTKIRKGSVSEFESANETISRIPKSPFERLQDDERQENAPQYFAMVSRGENNRQGDGVGVETVMEGIHVCSKVEVSSRIEENHDR